MNDRQMPWMNHNISEYPLKLERQCLTWYPINLYGMAESQVKHSSCLFLLHDFVPLLQWFVSQNLSSQVLLVTRKKGNSALS